MINHLEVILCAQTYICSWNVRENMFLLETLIMRGQQKTHANVCPDASRSERIKRARKFIALSKILKLFTFTDVNQNTQMKMIKQPSTY